MLTKGSILKSSGLGLPGLQRPGLGGSSRTALTLAYRDWKRPDFMGLDRFRPVRFTQEVVDFRRATDMNPYVVVRSESEDRASYTLLPEDNQFQAKGDEVSLQQLVEGHINSQYVSSLNKGWTYFEEGRYREACDTFGLAERLALEDNSSRAEAKWGRLFSAVGSSQVSLAVHELTWFLQSDPATGGIRDSRCMSRILDMPSRYGAESDFEDHLREVQLRVDRQPESPEYRALSAVFLWASPETRGQGRFMAGQLARFGAEGQSWARLSELMELADHVDSVRGKMKEGDMPAPAADAPVRP
jgi:hypothetical protein